MARKRMIDPSIWTDEGMARLTPRQQLLFIALFSNADDEGRLKASPDSLRLILPTIYGAGDEAEIAADVAAICGQMRHLQHYDVDGRQYIAFADFGAWQRIDRPSPSKLPPPPGTQAADFVEASSISNGALSEPSASTPASRARPEVSVKGKEKKLDQVRLGECVTPRERSANGRPRASPATHTHRTRQTRAEIQDALTQEFAPALGGEERARASIAKALNDPQSDRWKDFAVGLRNWLERDVVYWREHGGASAAQPGGSRGGMAESADPGIARRAAAAHERRVAALSGVSGRGVPGGPAP